MDGRIIISFFDDFIKPGDKRNRIVAIWTAVFLTAAHAFRWFNTAFNHDSLKVFQSDGSWQAYLGRYLVPAYLMLRGKIGAPFLIAMITAVFLIVANVLMVRILRIEKPLHVILFCALTATSPVLISLFSTFITATDIHILALLFAALSVYVLFEYKSGWVPGGLFLACSLALYQAYAQVAVTLILLRLLTDILTESDLKKVWKNAGRVILFLLVGAAVYFAGFVISMKLVYGLGMSQLPSNGAYNSLDGMSSLSLADFPKLFAGLFESFFDVFVNIDSRFLLLRGLANLTVLACSLVLLLISGASIKRKCMAVALMLLLSLGANFTYFLSRGMIHTLMTFSYTVLYGGVLALAELRRSSVARGLTATALIFIVWGNVVFANSFNLRNSLEEQATLSVMSRLLGKIESVEGYKPGETGVVLVGDLNDSGVKQLRHGYPKLMIIRDYPSFSVSYPESYANYFRDVLGYPVRILDKGASESYSEMDEVLSMPSFPSPGCVRMIGDVIVVRLSQE